MTSQVQSAVAGYLARIQQECREKGWGIHGERRPATAELLLREPEEVRIAFVKTALEQAGDLAPRVASRGMGGLSRILSGLLGTKPAGSRFDWLAFRTLGTVLSIVLREKPNVQPEDLAEMARSYARNIECLYHGFSLAPLIALVENAPRTVETEKAMRSLRGAFAGFARPSNTRENRQLLERIDLYLSPPEEQQLVTSGPWSKAVAAEVRNYPEPERTAWRAILAHCLAAQASTPPKIWRKQADQLTSALGAEKFRACALRWLDPASTPFATDSNTRMEDTDGDHVKGFVWLLTGFSDGNLCQAVADCGLACLRKIPNVGPVSARVGFACVNVLAEMPGMHPVSQLTRMRARVRYAVALKLIEKALIAAAERAGLSRDDLEDVAVPDYGFSAEGGRSEKIGDCSVDLTVVEPGGGKVDLQWKNAAGKVLKSPPAAIKQQHAARMKEVKRTATDLQKMLAAQRSRIEQFFINERKVGYEHWRKHLLHHPLMGVIVRRLIWRFDSDGKSALAVWHSGEMVNWDNEAVTGLNPGTTVQLWHPLHSDPQTILSWRCWLEDHRVVQPFKQAHREVYILTPAEEQTATYSNRFAAHVIRQHQFASLCQQRGWKYRLMGSGFDGHNVPTIDVPRRSLSAQFWVETPEQAVSADQQSLSGIDLCLLTDQVRFYGSDGQLRLSEVPPVVFSEIMRDVDLFVGVTSIGNDPTWFDHGDNIYGGYWNNFAFGDLSQTGETRRSILERLLPQLKIASRCKLEGKFLVVRGDLHTYKIHLGSANVLMEPGSHYLCIVADRMAKGGVQGRVYLPFEGDHTLAVILSKAFMLAADTKITDETILRQIGRPGRLAH